MEKEMKEKQGSLEIKWAEKKELLLIIALSLIAGIVVKIPQWFNLIEDIFYRRNLSFIILPWLSIYYGVMYKFDYKKIVTIISIAIISAVYINSIPGNDSNDAFIMSCVHMVILWFFIAGISFVGSITGDLERRVLFIKHLGELAIISGLMMAAIGLVSGMTIGLFSVIGLHIERFYFQNIAIWGIVAVPFLASSLLYNNPNILSNIPLFIARLFSPVVLLMLSIYLIAIMVTGKDPYNDREFLMIFNLLLIGVMALIIFNTGVSTNRLSKFQSMVLMLLSGITIIVCGIALSAILFRITEWGITPNRTVVLGSNVLVFVHLLLVFKSLFRHIFSPEKSNTLVQTIAFYLPVYFVWILFVVFLLPLIN